MNILYITKGDHVDYQNDCLLIGLRELFGETVIDYNKQSHNYISYDESLLPTLYGGGMTISRILPDIDIDRSDITSKIKNKYFDFIVYGSIWRCSEHIESILDYYPTSRVIAIDGEDETNIHPTFKLGIPYFKRELIYQHERLIPISFAVPTSKINFNVKKERDFSFITPLDRSTYIYTNEYDYYQDYSKSRFAVTVKKAGWDCLRHYEILSNGCIPIFTGIDKCPSMTMINFPKSLCMEVVDRLKTEPPHQIYDDLHNKFKDHLINNNTTLALAKYFITNLK